MNTNNSVRIKTFLGDFTSIDLSVNNFIANTPGIMPIGGNLAYIDPPLSTGETVSYTLMYRIF